MAPEGRLLTVHEPPLVLSERTFPSEPSGAAGWLNLYFSRRDKRSFVPKRGTVVGGATVTFARAAGVVYLVGISLFGLLIYALN